jgi:uncharacterized protein (TIGR02118 family)
MECHHTRYNNIASNMIKRISIVWKRPELTHAEFRRLWLGEHVDYAKRLKGVREYVIDFVPEALDGGPAGIATLRFDSREALESAFSDARLSEDLKRTRDQFAQSVQVMIVDEHVVVPMAGGKGE